MHRVVIMWNEVANSTLTRNSCEEPFKVLWLAFQESGNVNVKARKVWYVFFPLLSVNITIFLWVLASNPLSCGRVLTERMLVLQRQACSAKWWSSLVSTTVMLYQLSSCFLLWQGWNWSCQRKPNPSFLLLLLKIFRTHVIMVHSFLNINQCQKNKPKDIDSFSDWMQLIF